MKAMTLTAVAALLMAGPALAQPQPEVVTKQTTGEAAIVANNEVRAEKEARDRALRDAVEQVAGVLVSADTLTQNNQLISDRIFANSAGYVRKFEVVSKRIEKGVMYVTVKAEVGTAQLDKDLQAVKALIARLGNRKLAIILQEQVIHPSREGGAGGKEALRELVTSTNVMSTALTEAFRNDGWTIIDPNFVAGKLRLSAGAGLGATEAKEIGDLAKAEYLLYGNAVYREQDLKKDPAGSMIQDGVFVVTGEYDFAVFATDNGSQIGKISGKFETFERDRKTGKVVLPSDIVISYERTTFGIVNRKKAEITSGVRNAVIEYLRSAEQNGARVVVSVVGLPDYAAVQDFKKAVGSMSNVRDVKPGTFGSGKAQFDVTFVGTTDDLAGSLGAATFKAKKLSVVGVTANTVEVVVAK